MAETGRTTGSKLKVFVSYSRRDLDFADQLVAVLESQGFQTFIDRTGIYGAEQWEERLGQLILQGDTVVFLLSPDSAESDVCAWEVDEAIRRGKRIIPVLCRPLEGKRPHARLRDLNYIYFYPEKDVPGSGFGTGQARLVEALSVDFEWLRDHTRLEGLAARWQANGRQADSLLRGSELSACKAWRDRRPANAPELTDLQRAFLATSEEEDTARASAERKRLDEMATAQAARQKAIEEREVAVKREAEAQKARTRARQVIVWGSAAAAVLLVLGVAGFAYQQTLNVEKQREYCEGGGQDAGGRGQLPQRSDHGILFPRGAGQAGWCRCGDGSPDRAGRLAGSNVGEQGAARAPVCCRGVARPLWRPLRAA
jgi:hypothetical protein